MTPLLHRQTDLPGYSPAASFPVVLPPVPADFIRDRQAILKLFNTAENIPAIRERGVPDMTDLRGLTVGLKKGSYTIQEYIGCGMDGLVLRCTETGGETSFAMKISCVSGGIKFNSGYKYILNEISALKKLSEVFPAGGPSAPFIFPRFREAGFFSDPARPGQKLVLTVSSYLPEVKASGFSDIKINLSLTDALERCIKLCDAVTALGYAGIRHLDLTGENCVFHGSTPVIYDFARVSRPQIESKQGIGGFARGHFYARGETMAAERQLTQLHDILRDELARVRTGDGQRELKNLCRAIVGEFYGGKPERITLAAGRALLRRAGDLSITETPDPDTLSGLRRDLENTPRVKNPEDWLAIAMQNG